MTFDGCVSSARILAACIPLMFAWASAGTADPLATGRIAVSQTVQCCYREGAVSYVVIRQAGNDAAATKTSRLLAPLEPTLIIGTELAPGRYMISSFQRPCDGNCGFLDPPVDQCAAGPLELRAGTVINVLVSVIPFGGCTISTELEGV